MLALMQETEHRPFPLPEGPWVVWQECRNLLFASWPVLAEEVRPLVPEAFELDLWNDQAWLSIVPFDSGVKLRGMHSSSLKLKFSEVNIRTYVTYRGKPGVYFLSLDFSTRLPIQLIRALFELPVHHSHIGSYHEADYTILHEFGDQELHFSYMPLTAQFNAQPGTFEHWITERYCLFTLSRTGQVYIGHIHHQPWPLQRAQAAVRWEQQGDFKRVRLFGKPNVLCCAYQEMVAWPLYPCGQ